MRPFLLTALIAALPLCASTATLAADAASLTIGGEISPNACEVLLSPGTLDYGTIAAGSLRNAGHTTLPQMSFDASLHCASPIRVAMAFTDDRDGTEGDDTMRAETWFGLGNAAGKPIGGFQIVRTTASIVADGADVQTLEFTRGKSWLQMNNNFPEVSARSGYLLSWSATGTVPAAFTNVHVPLAVQAVLVDKASMPALADGVPLDGRATIALVYL